MQSKVLERSPRPLSVQATGRPAPMREASPDVRPAPTCAVLVERIGPYHFARLNALGDCVPTVAIEVCDMDATYAWNKVSQGGSFKRLTLSATAVAQPNERRTLVRRVRATLGQVNPAVVFIPGWADACSLAALQWCVETATPAIVLTASSAVGRTRAGWREFIKRRVLRLFSAGVGGGTPQGDYLESLGLARARIFQGCNVVDNRHFAEAAGAARQSAAAFRASLQLPEKYFLTICRFIEEKNLPTLLNAYAQYRQQAGTGAWKLVLLGDGPLKRALLEQRTGLGLDEHVLMPGFKQYAELPPYYGLAGAFVLPSVSETWGLVINEAMAAELPVLISDHCGCARDLVIPGRNGFTFAPHDAARLAQLMLQLAADACDRPAMGRHSRDLIRQWSPESLAATLNRAALVVQDAPALRTKWIDRALLRLLLWQRVYAGQPAVKE